ncbi:TPA: hypothetical protein ACPWNB_005992, partial [Pseudomonas aeruginosa]
MSGLAESFSFTPSDWGVSVRDGVAEGIYSLGYGSCHVQIVFEAGDRTEFLDSLPWRFVLPVSEIPDIRQGGFLAHLYDSNSEQDFTAYAFIDPETKMLNIQVNGKDV